MFDSYSKVDNENPSLPWAKWRDIILDKKQPRKIIVQHNTEIKGKISTQTISRSIN